MSPGDEPVLPPDFALRPLDVWSRTYPAFRRLLDAANDAAREGDEERYRAAHHAVHAWLPPNNPKLTKHERRVHKAFSTDKTAQDRASDWGVFPWEAANMYRRESAVRVYRRRCDADRFAEKSDPALNLVVRSLDREVRS